MESAKKNNNEMLINSISFKIKKIAVAERRKRQRQNRTWKRYEKKTPGVF
jgi:hypothetical protein